MIIIGLLASWVIPIGLGIILGGWIYEVWDVRRKK